MFFQEKDLTKPLDGDIMLTPGQIRVMYSGGHTQNRRKRKVQDFDDDSKQWLLPIRYTFDETYDNSQLFHMINHYFNKHKHHSPKVCI